MNTALEPYVAKTEDWFTSKISAPRLNTAWLVGLSRAWSWRSRSQMWAPPPTLTLVVMTTTTATGLPRWSRHAGRCCVCSLTATRGMTAAGSFGAISRRRKFTPSAGVQQTTRIYNHLRVSLCLGWRTRCTNSIPCKRNENTIRQICSVISQ